MKTTVFLITNKKLNIQSEKGSALTLAFVVIMIMIMLGTAALALSLSSVRMSQAFTNSSDVYLDLDSAANSKLLEIDKALKGAEDYARNYIVEERYKEDASGLIRDKYTAILDASFSESYFNEAKYLELMEPFIPRLYDYMYMTNALTNLALVEEVSLVNANAGLDPGYAGTFDELVFSDEDIEVSFTAEQPLSDKDSLTKKIDVKLYISTLSEGIIHEYAFRKFDANPILGYALASQESISFSGLNHVNGDVFAGARAVKDKTFVAVQAEERPDKKAGIHTEGILNVKGNVYTAGYFYTTGSEVNLTIGSVSPEIYEIKKSMFGGEGYFQDMTGNEQLGDYGEGGTGVLPFFYKDYYSGNIYAKMISIDRSAAGSSFTINGNALVADDLEVSGNNSKISIGGNYIGVSSGDIGHEVSSAVINNSKHTGSEITLLGGLVVPGYVFLDLGTSYYQTTESVTSSDFDLFMNYVSSPLNGDNDDTGFSSYSINGMNVLLKDSPTNDWYTGRFVGTPDAGIKISDKAGYAPGLIVADKNGTSSFYLDTSVAGAYTLTSALLSDNVSSAVEHLGTKGTYLSSDLFSSYVNGIYSGSRMIYNPVGNQLVISGDMKGIVYCDGALEITGTGSFSGTVIASGDITVNGDITFNYDEDVIYDILEHDSETLAFFGDGMYAESNVYFLGKPVSVYHDSLTYSSLVEKGRRYRITEYKESHYYK